MRTIGEFEGQDVHEATLTSATGVRVSVMSFGAVIRDWTVPDASGTPRSVTLGFADFAPYPTHSRSFGIIAGRVANRVRDGRFTLAGRTHQLETNHGRHHLHGGTRGLGRTLWTLEPDGEAQVRLTRQSPSGEMGYPGAVRFAVLMRLEDNTLTFDIRGEPDEPTPIALAQHSYYTLGGPAPDHRLMVHAKTVTETDGEDVPTGNLLPVDGTRFDFRSPTPVGRDKLDMNFCLSGEVPAATLEGEAMHLSLQTDRPGLQVFNAYNFKDIPVEGHGGVRYGRYAGVALEAQDWPDAVNHAHFPAVIAHPDAPYTQMTSVTIAARA